MMPIYDANNQFDRNFFKLYGEMQAEAAALSGIDAKLRVVAYFVISVNLRK